MIRQRNHPGAEPDRLRAFGGHRDEQFRRTDQLPSGGMVFADPGLVEPQPIEPLHQFQIPVDAGRGVLVHRVEGRQEGAVAQPDAGHDHFLGVVAAMLRGEARLVKGHAAGVVSRATAAI